jgi:subtilisin family serine protease
VQVAGDPEVTGIRVSAIAAADKLQRAAADGARIVSMSMSFVDKGDGCIAASAENADLVAWTDALLRQPILWAAQNGHDVLWVLSAGNECRNAATQSPPNLVRQFPTNVMVVGSTGRDDSRSWFSNFGSTVTVSAPGEGTLSAMPRSPCWFGVILCTDRYDTKGGTSMSTPHVSGLAVLVRAADPSRTASQLRSCIVAGALRDGVAVTNSGPRIDAPSAVTCEGSLDLPPEVDLVLAVDLTGSMGSVINQVKAEITTTLDALRVEAPSTDFQVAVVSYEDYPGTYDSRPCPNSSYVDQYGGAGDEPFRIERSLTSLGDELQATVDGLELGYGADAPESYGRVLWEIGQADTRAELGLRPGALTLLVNFGDDVPHDDDINADIVDPPLSDGDTGIDPGRSGVINCGGDDIDFQDDALPALVATDTRLLHVDSSWRGYYEPYWRSWAATTGGAYTTLDGTTPLAEVLLELVAAVS